MPERTEIELESVNRRMKRMRKENRFLIGFGTSELDPHRLCCPELWERLFMHWASAPKCYLRIMLRIMLRIILKAIFQHHLQIVSSFTFASSPCLIAYESLPFAYLKDAAQCWWCTLWQSSGRAGCPAWRPRKRSPPRTANEKCKICGYRAPLRVFPVSSRRARRCREPCRRNEESSCERELNSGKIRFVEKRKKRFTNFQDKRLVLIGACPFESFSHFHKPLKDLLLFRFTADPLKCTENNRLT